MVSFNVPTFHLVAWYVFVVSHGFTWRHFVFLRGAFLTFRAVFSCGVFLSFNVAAFRLFARHLFVVSHGVIVFSSPEPKAHR